jgi:predicted dehydrogenase
MNVSPSRSGETVAQRVRIGILGAAKIAPTALVQPAHKVEEAEVVAVAARSQDRAHAFATKHGIARTHPSYEALLADPEIDAVYNPLPNGLHAEWTLKAIAAGKHVLCEKPFTSNAREAQEVASAGEAAGVVVMEAFHYRYHPLAARMREIVTGGQLGRLREIRTSMCFPLFKASDIRYRHDLGGGAMMDAGCYALHAQRLLGDDEPRILSAAAKLRGADVDRAMSVRLEHEGGVRGVLECSLWSRRPLDLRARVIGERGELRVFNYLAPQYFHRLTLSVDGRKSHEQLKGESSYAGQLRAFTGAVLRGTPTLTPASDAVVTMRLIDQIYRAAGMRPRGE